MNSKDFVHNCKNCNKLIFGWNVGDPVFCSSLCRERYELKMKQGGDGFDR